jgi:hypothetical protein
MLPHRSFGSVLLDDRRPMLLRSRLHRLRSRSKALLVMVAVRCGVVLASPAPLPNRGSFRGTQR